MSSNQDSNMEEVTEAELRLFKTTLLARRFPGVKDMKEEEIKKIIIADRKATGKKMEAKKKTYPKTEFERPPIKRETLPQGIQATFTPCNPSQAKEDHARTWADSFNCLDSPYALDRVAYLTDKHADESKRMDPFVPSCPSQAKATVAVDAYLNGADSELKKEELATMRTKGREHRAQYDALYNTRKGKTLV